MNMVSKLGVATGALLLSVAGIAPAQAQRWTHTDPAGDVTSASGCTAQGDGCTETVDATRTMPDIVRFLADHRATRVNVWARYRDLTAAGTRMHQVRYVTNEGVRRHLTIATSNGRIILRQLTRDSDGKKVACTGIRQSIDYSANTVSISIPRSCLSAPRTVRVGFGTYAFRNINDLTQGGWYDDALAAGSAPGDLRLGTSIRRG
jgi:hypothetical protein